MHKITELPAWERLFKRIVWSQIGDLKGLYSRRLNHQHRLVYQVLEQEQIVKILSMWTHYEK